MPRKSTPQEKTVMDRMIEVNPFTPWGKQREETSNKSVTAMAETMREMVMSEMMMDMMEQTSENRLKRQLEREKEKRTLSTQSAAVNPMAKFMEGFSDPNFLATWSQMDPDLQGQVWQMVLNYGMMNPMQANMMNPMMYQYMLTQQQRPGEQIKIQDLITMFTTGMGQAMELAKGTQPVNQPTVTDMIESVSKIMEPLTRKADEASNRTYELLLEQLRGQKTGGLSETIGVIKEVADSFGGGGASQADIEIARLQSQNAYQMAQLQADMQIRAEEMRAESSKWDQIGGIALTGLGAVGGVVAQNMRQMGQQAAHQAAPQAHPEKTMPPMQRNLPGAPTGGYAQVQCGECNHTFQVGLTPDGKPPKRIQCPSCGETLEE